MKLVLCLVLMAGCGEYRSPYFSSSRLVVVAFDPRFDALEVPSSNGVVKVIDALQHGLRYWDGLGAKMRSLEMMTPDEFDHIADAETLKVNWRDLSTPYVGIWTPHSRSIQFDMDYFAAPWWEGCGEAARCPTDEQVSTMLSATIAHEVGHSMGLGHVADYMAVMCAGNSVYNDKRAVDASDVAEFERDGR